MRRSGWPTRQTAAFMLPQPPQLPAPARPSPPALRPAPDPWPGIPGASHLCCLHPRLVFTLSVKVITPNVKSQYNTICTFSYSLQACISGPNVSMESALEHGVTEKVPEQMFSTSSWTMKTGAGDTWHGASVVFYCHSLMTTLTLPSTPSATAQKPCRHVPTGLPPLYSSRARHPPAAVCPWTEKTQARKEQEGAVGKMKRSHGVGRGCHHTMVRRAVNEQAPRCSPFHTRSSLA